jgi:hypothetical protein
MPATVELLSAQPVEAAKAGELLSPAELSTRLYYDRIQCSTLLPTLRLLTDRFLGTQNFDPVARDPVVRVHQMMLTELAGQESYLIEVYRSTLQRLPDAANEQFVRSSRFSGND